ncbi:MAG: glycosyl transferase [Parcubacteria group bacterium CG11_big_fil_rev_8_21_14_0_20_39_14]|nr:MAG: glycosyl transferase [Parcubacteria group bacterium CG11_big_fil_rev_8_21_14_0_20_39_14]PIS35567.1 MAG: glycosyl transferase [Parcubacteria group bacterium CG08_land_8_20_14_0_20_38_56]
MVLSIIIPVFNEENLIEEILKRVDNAQVLNWEKEIIVVDDGSTDDSKSKIQNLKSKVQNLRIISHKKNLGKGAAIRTALNYVTGDYVLIQDADLEYSPNDFQKLLSPIQKGEAQIVYGSRNLEPAKRGYFLNFWGGKFLTFLTNLLFKTSLTDINTGYKVFKTEILKNLKLESSRFEFCEEVTARALKAGYKIVEVPISYNPRGVREGKKLRPIDGLVGFWAIVRLKFFN